MTSDSMQIPRREKDDIIVFNERYQPVIDDITSDIGAVSNIIFLTS